MGARFLYQTASLGARRGIFQVFLYQSGTHHSRKLSQMGLSGWLSSVGCFRLQARPQILSTKQTLCFKVLNSFSRRATVVIDCCLISQILI